jgi:hypothetical protein
MAVMLTISINQPPPANQPAGRNSEVRWLEQQLVAVRTELGRGSRNVTSGTAGGNGSWTYTPVATGP